MVIKNDNPYIQDLIRGKYITDKNILIYDKNKESIDMGKYNVIVDSEEFINPRESVLKNNSILKNKSQKNIFYSIRSLKIWKIYEL